MGSLLFSLFMIMLFKKFIIEDKTVYCRVKLELSQILCSWCKWAIELECIKPKDIDCGPHLNQLRNMNNNFARIIIELRMRELPVRFEYLPINAFKEEIIHKES